MTFYDAGVIEALTKLGFPVTGAKGAMGLGASKSPTAVGGVSDIKKMTTGIRDGVGDIIKAPSPPNAPKPNPAGVEASQRSAT